jgi:hypothetical protein
VWLTPDETGKSIYGGVRTDCLMFLTACDEAIRPKGAADFLCSVGVASAFVVDIPLSAVGDTLTLPWTITATLIARPARDADAKEETKPEYPKVIEPFPGTTMVISDPRLVQ